MQINELLRKAKDKKVIKAFQSYSQYPELFDVYQNFSDIYMKAWVLEEDTKEDLKILLTAAGLNTKQVDAAITFLNLCDED